MNKICLKEVLKDFLYDSRSKSILIDGPWGCGKTYEVMNFIKENKKKKIYYLSLFGLESIDEINTSLYEQTKKGKRYFKHSAMLISKAIRAVPIIPNISEALEYQLDIIENKEVKKKSIIVLDDLERLSTKVSYTDLMGYINSLYLSGCRFICMVSLDNIDEDRKQDFHHFKEKVFDSVYQISGFNEKIIDEIFQEFNIPNINETYELFENNLRLAFKTMLFYKKALERFEKTKTNELDFDKLDLLKACVWAVKISLNNYEYKKKDDDISYDSYVKEYGETITKNIYYFRSNHECKNIPRFEDIVDSLVSAFRFFDFGIFEDKFISTKFDEKNSILKYEFYFLSDDHKSEYINAFVSLLNTELEWSGNETQILRNILMFSNYTFDNDLIKRIAILAKDKVDFSLGVPMGLGLLDKEYIDKNKLFIESLKNCLNDIKKVNLIEGFGNALANSDYSNMRDIIMKNEECDEDERKAFANYLVSNNFFLPDISGDIDRKIWSYCHSIAKFVASNEKTKEFIDLIKETHKGNKTDSELDRFLFLINEYTTEHLTEDDIN